MPWVLESIETAMRIAEEFYRQTGRPMLIELVIPSDVWVYVLGAVAVHFNFHVTWPIQDQFRVHDNVLLRRAT